jgi:hypothetical protein
MWKDRFSLQQRSSHCKKSPSHLKAVLMNALGISSVHLVIFLHSFLVHDWVTMFWTELLCHQKKNNCGLRASVLYLNFFQGVTFVLLYGTVFLCTERLKFSPRPVNKKLELGSSARVYCKAQGALPPVIKWFKVMCIHMYILRFYSRS